MLSNLALFYKLHPLLYSLFTNWLAASKLVIFIFLASHKVSFSTRITAPIFATHTIATNCEVAHQNCFGNGPQNRMENSVVSFQNQQCMHQPIVCSDPGLPPATRGSVGLAALRFFMRDVGSSTVLMHSWPSTCLSFLQRCIHCHHGRVLHRAITHPDAWVRDRHPSK